jgi:hypothetical protein
MKRSKLLKRRKRKLSKRRRRKLNKKKKIIIKLSFIKKKIKKNKCNFSTFLKQIRKPNVVSVVHCT